MPARQTSLSANIVAFARYLRLKGFRVSSEDEANALLAMETIDFHNTENFKLALKSIFCRSAAELSHFDNFFLEFWKERSKAVDSKTKQNQEKQKNRIGSADPLKSLQSWLKGNQNNETEQTASYSIHESLSQKDFSRVPKDDVDEIIQTIRSIGKNLALRLSRRQESSKSGTLDLLKTLRRNIRNDSEMIHLMFRKPKRNRTRLLLLCDVSKSMELYSTFFIQFMYAIQNVFKRMETFVFSTQLIRVTSLLRLNSFDEAMKLLGHETTWSGGTRIGESLQKFVDDYSRLLNKQTLVIIVSDGWDTGNIETIERAMSKIHSASRKVIWLNPLAGFSEFKPEVKGMQSALPYIDSLAPVHNLDSLRQLRKLI